MPAYMVPADIELVPGPLPRNPNGKIDRKRLVTDWLARQPKSMCPPDVIADPIRNP